MHDLDFDHEHEEMLTDQERLAIARAIWEQETVDMMTVGIDIGSSTTHLLFARVIMRREQHDLSSRFTVVERRVIWRSPIMLTPFLPDGTIDAHELQHFFAHCYYDAGFHRADIDSGAVILTGEAIKRVNARAINHILANDSGKFVCATAGHRLESILAAHGSGAVKLSERRGTGLHVDIGGGTTKLALVRNGEVLSVAAFAVGGRLIAKDAQGFWSRIDGPARQVAEALGIPATADAMAEQANRDLIIQRMAGLVMDHLTDTPLDDLGRALLLTEPLSRDHQPDFISFSGGVAEYIFGYANHDFGDIARPLADRIVEQIRCRLELPVIDAGQRIRATVIGASQFTVQVSGKTLHLPPSGILPERDLPVIHLRDPLPETINPIALAGAFLSRARLKGQEQEAPVALAFDWSGLPEHSRLRALAEAIAIVAQDLEPKLLAVVTDGDIGQSIGHILQQELGFSHHLVAIDGVQLRDLDFVDIGTPIDPPGVVPVVIKSLLFS